MKQDFTRSLADEPATLAAGAALAQVLESGCVCYLHGDLGAGKTTLARGLLHALGHEGKVKSPTYTLLEPYQLGALNLYHFDLYRFADPEEWEAAGFRDYFNPQSVCLVEWPEKAGELLPPADIDILLKPEGGGRRLQIRANSPLGIRIIEALDNL